MRSRRNISIVVFPLSAIFKMIHHINYATTFLNQVYRALIVVQDLNPFIQIHILRLTVIIFIPQKKPYRLKAIVRIVDVILFPSQFQINNWSNFIWKLSNVLRCLVLLEDTLHINLFVLGSDILDLILVIRLLLHIWK